MRATILTTLTILLLLILPLAASFAQEAQPRDLASAFAAFTGREIPPGLGVDSEGRLVAEGQAYRARLLGDRVAIEVPGSALEPEAPELELSFTGAGRGGGELSEPLAFAPVASGLSADYARGPLVERYTARALDIEQSFEIPAHLPGSGDLVLRFVVGGNVQAPATEGPRHGAIEFKSAAGSGIRYGEACVLDHSGRRAEVLTAYDGTGHLELVVPGSFLEEATYPVLVDPAIGPVFIAGGDPVWNDVNPDVAYDPQQLTFLVVWQRVFVGDSDIRAALYDQYGTLLNPLIFVETSPAADATNPSVAYFDGSGSLASNRFLTAWEQSTDGGTTVGVRARLIDADDGALSAPAFSVTSPALGVRDRNPDVAGGPPMLVAWDRTPAGAMVATSVRARALSWFNLGAPAAVVLDPEHALESVATGNVGPIRLAQSAMVTTLAGVQWSIWRAVWHRLYPLPAPGDADVRTIAFRTRSGAVPDFAVMQPPSTVPGGGGVGQDEYDPDIALMAPDIFSVASANYLVVWNEGPDIRGHRYDTDSAVGADFDIQVNATLQYAPVVGAGTCEFTVAYFESGPGEFDLDVYAARVLADGTVPTNHRLIDSPGAIYQFHLRASSRPVIYAAANQRNTSLLAWAGQTGPAGVGLNDVRARFFEPLAGNASFFGVACGGPGGALPQIGYQGGLPHPGNPDFAITLTGAPPLSPATLVLGTTAISMPIAGTAGCFLYVGPEYAYIPTATDAAGSAIVPLPVPCVSWLHGFFVACQWGIPTPGFNAFGWITSNDVDLSWSH